MLSLLHGYRNRALESEGFTTWTLTSMVGVRRLPSGSPGARDGTFSSTLDMANWDHRPLKVDEFNLYIIG